MGRYRDRSIDNGVERVQFILMTLSNMFKSTCDAMASKVVSPARMNCRHAHRQRCTRHRAGPPLVR